MEYKVLESDIRSRVNSSLAIERNVREYLADGWQTASQLMMVGDKFYQAMTRESQEVSIEADNPIGFDPLPEPTLHHNFITKEGVVTEIVNEYQKASRESLGLEPVTSESVIKAINDAVTSANAYQVNTRLVVKKSGEFTELEELGLGDMITIEKYARDVRLYDCYLHKQDRNTPITFEELEEYFQVV